MISTALRTLFALALLVFAAPAFGGYYYESTTRTEAGRKPHVQDVRAWVDGENAKVEFTSGNKKDLLAPGTYLLTNDGGRTLYLVDPKEETYQVWDIDALLATVGAVMESLAGVVDMTFTDLKSERVLNEPGNKLLGRETRHVRWRNSYSMSLKLGPIKRHQDVEVVQDSWVTDALTDPGFGAWLRKDRHKTGHEELDRLISQEMAKVEGMPLRSEVVSTSRSRKGKEQVTRTTVEVTVLREESVGASTFSLPEGYRRVETMPTGR